MYEYYFECVPPFISFFYRWTRVSWIPLVSSDYSCSEDNLWGLVAMGFLWARTIRCSPSLRIKLLNGTQSTLLTRGLFSTCLHPLLVSWWRGIVPFTLASQHQYLLFSFFHWYDISSTIVPYKGAWGHSLCACAAGVAVETPSCWCIPWDGRCYRGTASVRQSRTEKSSLVRFTKVLALV